MSGLPLPPIAPLSGGDLPVSDVEDILLILPQFLKPENDSPVRDDILETLVALMRKYQIDSSESVAMNDLLRAIGSGLVGLGEERGVFKIEGESDETYRLRILRAPKIVTPEAIIEAVNTIIAPFTGINAEYSESVQDRWYIGSGDKPWHSFVYNSETNSPSPYYLDRLYEDDQVANLEYFRPNSNPGGARVYSDTHGRLFMIRIPDITGIENLGAFFGVSGRRFYLGGAGVASPLRTRSTTLNDTLNLIIATINRLKGHSIRYILFMDPKLGL